MIRQNELFDALQKDLDLAGATILDVSGLLWDEDQARYRMDHENTALYYDNNHLTMAGARYLAETFEPVFSQVGREENIVIPENQL